MTVSIAVLIPSKFAEPSLTTQYTANGVYTAIDKFTATNISGAAATLSVHLVSGGGTGVDSNAIVKTKTLQPLESYTFPEIVGHVLAPSGFIATNAGTGSAINIRASGREVSQ